MGNNHVDFSSFLRYEPSSGDFIWVANNRMKGKVAGTFDKDGYVQIVLLRKPYKAHRLAWYFVYGEFPDGEIDHKNRVKNDNRIENLRLLSRTENSQNKLSAQSNSSTGLLGVVPVNGKFQGRIRVDGKTKYLGTFLTAEMAHSAYLLEKTKRHNGFYSKS